VLILQLVSVQSHLAVVGGRERLLSRISVIEAASVPGIACRAIAVMSLKTSGNLRSAKTTLASASCSSFTLFIAGFRSLS
jgi:hypothetical protein